MILDSTTEKITLVLAGATTTTAGDIYGSWTDSDPAATPKFNAGSNTATTSGTSSVDVIPVPGAATARRSVDEISVCNNDTQPMTVTIRHSDGATHRRVFGPCTLQVGEKIQYKRDSGWNVFTVTGAVKVTAVQSTVEPGYIDGLQMVWNSATSVSVTPGTCYIPASGFNVNFPSTITKAGLALSASTLYHIYGFLNSGVPDIEIVTTAPSTPYNGVARTKTGDTTRRYLGTLRTDGSGNVYRFVHNTENGLVAYETHVNTTPFLVLNAGVATVATNVSCSAVVPITSRCAVAFMDDSDPSVRVGLGNSDMGVVGGGNFLAFIFANSALTTLLILDASQQFSYTFFSAPSSGNFSVRVTGYLYER